MLGAPATFVLRVWMNAARRGKEVAEVNHILTCVAPETTSAAAEMELTVTTTDQLLHMHYLIFSVSKVDRIVSRLTEVQSDDVTYPRSQGDQVTKLDFRWSCHLQNPKAL